MAAWGGVVAIMGRVDAAVVAFIMGAVTAGGMSAPVARSRGASVPPPLVTGIAPVWPVDPGCCRGSGLPPPTNPEAHQRPATTAPTPSTISTDFTREPAGFDLAGLDADAHPHAAPAESARPHLGHFELFPFGTAAVGEAEGEVGGESESEGANAGAGDAGATGALLGVGGCACVTAAGRVAATVWVDFSQCGHNVNPPAA